MSPVPRSRHIVYLALPAPSPDHTCRLQPNNLVPSGHVLQMAPHNSDSNLSLPPFLSHYCPFPVALSFPSLSPQTSEPLDPINPVSVSVERLNPSFLSPPQSPGSGPVRLACSSKSFQVVSSISFSSSTLMCTFVLRSS